MADLRMVQPGRLVSNALKYSGRRRKVGVHQSGNLERVASVITAKRVYNLEFIDYCDLKAFYNTIETVFAVKLLTTWIFPFIIRVKHSPYVEEAYV